MNRLTLVGAAFLAILPVTAFARGRLEVFAGGGFAPYYYGPYGPYYGVPYGVYPYGPAFGVPNAGEVKLDTHVKDAEVFINGNFAGTVNKLKAMTMQPGNYTIEVRAPGRAAFHQDIHVVAGKTMTLHPDLPVTPPPTGS